MKTIAPRWKLLLTLGFLVGILLTSTALTIWPSETSALTITQLSLTPTPFFRFPVVSNADTSGFFDHHGVYPGDYSDGYVTFYDGRQSVPGNGFWFTCPGVGNGWVGCEIPASSEVDCPDFRELWYDAHHGTDFEYAANWRTGSVCNRDQFAGITRPVYAPAPGKVQLVQLNHPYNGNAVFIKHDIDGDGNYDDDKTRSAYLHFESLDPDIQVGSMIHEGQYLGLGGMTGLAWTPHLHFEVQRANDANFQDKWPVDPFGWMGIGVDPWPYANYPLWRYETALPLILRNYAVCTEGGGLIQNGGFEEGQNHWIEDGSSIIRSTSDPYPPPSVYEGEWAAWFGGYNNANDNLYQYFTVPANLDSLVLNYFVWVGTEETGDPADYLFVTLRDVNNNVLSYDQLDNSTLPEHTWVRRGQTISGLGARAGQQLRLLFQATTDDRQITSFVVDNVSLVEHCGTGTSVLSVSPTESKLMRKSPPIGSIAK